jgi:hypothetical protein
VDGRLVAQDGRVLGWDPADTVRLASSSLARVASRAGLSA